MSGLESTDRLLSLARELLRGTVAPTVQDDLRFPTAMIASAMAIAARQLELGAAHRAEEEIALMSLYPREKSGVVALRRRLCRDLRDRATTDYDTTQLRAVLADIVRRRLLISQPDHTARC